MFWESYGYQSPATLRKIVDVSLYLIFGDRKFDLMLDHQAFISVRKYRDLDELLLLVIVTLRKRLDRSAAKFPVRERHPKCPCLWIYPIRRWTYVWDP